MVSNDFKYFFSLLYVERRQYRALRLRMSLALRHIKYNIKKKFYINDPTDDTFQLVMTRKRFLNYIVTWTMRWSTCVQIKMSNFVWRAVKYCRTILVCLLCPLWFKSLLGCCASIFGILTLNVVILYKVVFGWTDVFKQCMLVTYYHVPCLTLTKHHIVKLHSKVKSFFYKKKKFQFSYNLAHFSRYITSCG